MKKKTRLDHFNFMVTWELTLTMLRLLPAVTERERERESQATIL